jgi:hypothetical protein
MTETLIQASAIFKTHPNGKRCSIRMAVPVYSKSYLSLLLGEVAANSSSITDLSNSFYAEKLKDKVKYVTYGYKFLEVLDGRDPT